MHSKNNTTQLSSPPHFVMTMELLIHLACVWRTVPTPTELTSLAEARILSNQLTPEAVALVSGLEASYQLPNSSREGSSFVMLRNA